MRSSLLFVFIIFIAGFVNAQVPTITSTSEAVPGDVLIYLQAQLSGVAIPATGANLTWNYTGLIDSGANEIDSFVSASSTPNASVFPSSNLALNNGGGVYSYFQTTSSDWTILGLISPGADTSYYLSALDEFHFPFSYLSSFIDSSKYVMHFTGIKDTTESVAIFQGTGYGTLKIPGKTYTNVLEVAKKNIQRQRFGSDTTASILFVTPGVHSFILQITLSSPNIISEIKYATGSIVTSTNYTFNGNGNWTVAGNWSGGVVPASPIPSGTTVTISPQAGGSCSLNVPVTFSSGATLTVTTGAVFKVMGNLTVIK